MAIEKTLGDLYCALGSLSVREKMFFESLIVLSNISLASAVSGWAIDCVSSGKNFLIRDSIIGKPKI